MLSLGANGDTNDGIADDTVGGTIGGTNDCNIDGAIGGTNYGNTDATKDGSTGGTNDDASDGTNDDTTIIAGSARLFVPQALAQSPMRFGTLTRQAAIEHKH